MVLIHSSLIHVHPYKAGTYKSIYLLMYLSIDLSIHLGGWQDGEEDIACEAEKLRLYAQSTSLHQPRL